MTTKKRIDARSARFLIRVIETKNPIRAYREVFEITDLPDRQIMVDAQAILDTQEARDFMLTHRAKINDVTGMELADCRDEWKRMFDADPTELFKLHNQCCRYCYGTDHKRQWTPAEYSEECKRVTQRNKLIENPKYKEPIPEIEGGIDYDAQLPPHPKCPECSGFGSQVIVKLTDVNQWSDDARRLFRGYKQTKHGIEIQFADKTKILERMTNTALEMAKLGLIEAPQDETVSLDVTPENAHAIYEKLKGQ